jgi:hypothetical protein
VGGEQVGFWGLRKKNPNEDKLYALDDCPYTDTAKYPWVKDSGGAVFHFTMDVNEEGFRQPKYFSFLGEICTVASKASYNELLQVAMRQRGEYRNDLREL